MKVGRVMLVLSVTGVFFIAMALYSCSDNRFGDRDESCWEPPATPAVSLQSKVGVLRRERVLRPVSRQDVPWLKENIKDIFRKLENS